MADHTSAQATVTHDDGHVTTVRMDLLRQKLAEQPAPVIVKVGNALEF